MATMQERQWTAAGYEDAMGGRARRRAVGFRLSSFYNAGHRAGMLVRKGRKPIVLGAFRQEQRVCSACGWTVLEEVCERVVIVGRTEVDRREVSRGPVGQSVCQCVRRAFGMVA
jgi:hypothetical protein